MYKYQKNHNKYLIIMTVIAVVTTTYSIAITSVMNNMQLDYDYKLNTECKDNIQLTNQLEIITDEYNELLEKSK